jgi:hypothetical protein
MLPLEVVQEFQELVLVLVLILMVVKDSQVLSELLKRRWMLLTD